MTVLAATLVALGSLGCASSREVVVGTDPGGAGGAKTSPTGAAVSTASLESELSRLIVSQKAYYEENGYYSGDLESLGFTAGSGVRIDVLQGDSDGFSAIARSGDAECAVFSGDVRAPRGYVSIPDRPACRG
jgi:hypothetical protein